VRTLSERGNVGRGLVSVVSSPFHWVPPFSFQYHSIVNVLSILPKFTKIVKVLDHTLDTLLFFMQPIWLQENQCSMVLYNIVSLVMIANILKTW